MCGVGCAVRRVFAGLSQRGGEFDRRSGCVRFVVNKLALGKCFSSSTSVYPISIIPPMLHPHIQVTVIRKTNGRRLGTFQKKQCSSVNREALKKESIFRYLSNNNSEHFDVWSRSMANTYQRNKQNFIYRNGCAKEISKKIKDGKNKK